MSSLRLYFWLFNSKIKKVLKRLNSSNGRAFAFESKGSGFKNLFGNFENFKKAHATYYSVLVECVQISQTLKWMNDFINSTRHVLLYCFILPAPLILWKCATWKAIYLRVSGI